MSKVSCVCMCSFHGDLRAVMWQDVAIFGFCYQIW